MSYRDSMNKYRSEVDDNLLGIDEFGSLIDLRDGMSGDIKEKTKQAIALRLEQLDKELYDAKKLVENKHD